MPLFSSLSDVPDDLRGAAIALGNFDGVHLGHAHVLQAIHAARPDAPRAVLTFEPHPREFFRPEDPPFRLTLPAERAEALAALGVQAVFQLPFDLDFSNLSAEAFINDVLHAGLGATHIACGADFAFGHRRGGDVNLLATRAEALGIGLTVVPALTDAEGPLSSTRIRRALQDGYPERAAAMLGRPHTIRGIVSHGDKRGRTIGFPTANIPLGRHLEPARGVYAVTSRLPDGQTLHGVANIGNRPTVGGTESRLEAHFFDFAGDLYGLELAIALHGFIRAEKKFSGLDELRGQIAQDAAAARHLLDQATAGPA
ncbi:MAG: riboflavin biosynthesis protein RibF [Rhodospirillales bacterium 20-60-12]|nr:MAG: riboflavin biosynthesis protein RibF [Rhodospirillales bacterium 20-60-12]HQT65970.1 bifunctional riboflavin kinase/FAD synthetase [Acetobacteraceae bacterium]HQU01513.1 bifunctional riboflavin kinase/FAD synthetase [Acetobacteraceae bacterium]